MVPSISHRRLVRHHAFIFRLYTFFLLFASLYLGGEAFTGIPVPIGTTRIQRWGAVTNLPQSRAKRDHRMTMGLFNFGPGFDIGKKKNCQKRNSLLGTVRTRQFVKRLFSRTHAKIQSLLMWQRRNRRNALAAALLAFSVLFSSRAQVPYVTNSEHQLSPSCQSSVAVSSSMLEKHHLELSGGGNLGSSSAVLKKAVQSRQSSGQAQRRRVAESEDPKKRIIFQKKDYVPRPPLAAAQGRRNKNTELALEEKLISASRSTTRTLREAFEDLSKYMKGPKSDTLFLLAATALITPICQRLGTSPILGFLAAGMLLGPNGMGLISGIHTTETLADLGIVFFLFEMGIELSFDRLLSMRKDVFGLGLSQFLVTAVAIAGVGSLSGLPANALVVLGGGLALSSSAFVLQLLKDKNQLATRFGKASFGVLLFQDLAVVPLLVVTPILAGSGQGLAAALGSAVVKAALALGSIGFVGRVMLNPLFKTVAQARSQEAFLGVILLTVLSMSFMTEGLGLSNTLGAFLAGVLLSETKYRFQVEADIAPFRGILLGLFFVTVGFEIDLNLIASKLPLVSAIVVGLVLLKAIITTALSLAFGLSLSTSQQTGLILSQGGEFAFVAFGLARGLMILDPETTKLMLTSVSLTMAITPFLYELGSRIAKRLEEKSDFTHYLGQDRDASEIKESDDFAVVVGYGAVGKVVCDVLDRKFIKYVGIEVDPNKAIQARNKGLPVFYGDVARQEVAEAFNVGKAKAIIVTISDKAEATRVVILLRRMFPDMKIFARAKNADHAERLQKTLDVVAMVPILPEDNVLMTLPFCGAVLKSLGAPAEEVNAILESKRKEVMSGKGLAETEEEAVLTQLGIITETTETGSSAADDESEDYPEESAEDQQSTIVAAAAAVVEETKETNPILAQVIEANVPEIVEAEKVVESSPSVEDVIEDVIEPKKENPIVAQLLEATLPEIAEGDRDKASSECVSNDEKVEA